MHRLIMGLVAAGFAVGLAASAQATTIQFHDGSVAGPIVSSDDLNCISANGSDCYGHRASGATSPHGTTYTPDGDTPKIAAVYTGTFRQHNNGFGQSTYLSTDNTDPSYLTLTADSGWKIDLTSITLDIDHGFGAVSTGVVDIFEGGIPTIGSTVLKSLSISGDHPVTTALAILVSELTIRLPSANYGLQFLTFSQQATAVTPIPAALPLFASGLLGLGALRWRRKKAKAA